MADGRGRIPLSPPGERAGVRGIGRKGGARQTTTNEHFDHHVNLPMFEDSAVS